MHIRPCTNVDLDDVVRLFAEVVDERIWLGTEPGFDQDRLRERWAATIERGGPGALYVAAEDDVLVGFIGTYPGSTYGCTLGMFVRARHRGQGIGSALLSKAIAWAKRSGEPILSLGVFPHNASAIRLYERNGFKERHRDVGAAKRQNGDVWDMIVMTRSCRE